MCSVKRVGKNGLLITENYGSYVFIGEIVTDLEMELPPIEIKHCNNCGICKTHCPVGLEKSNCLSKLSQKKGELDEESAVLLKKHKIIWGCDICAEACPLNKGTKKTYINEFIEGYRDCYICGEDIKGRAFEWRGEKTVKRNFDLINNP